MTHSTTAACDYMEGDSEEGRGEEVPGASWEISRQYEPFPAQLRHGSWLPERSLHESFITQESLKPIALKLQILLTPEASPSLLFFLKNIALS